VSTIIKNNVFNNNGTSISLYSCPWGTIENNDIGFENRGISSAGSMVAIENNRIGNPVNGKGTFAIKLISCSGIILENDQIQAENYGIHAMSSFLYSKENHINIDNSIGEEGAGIAIIGSSLGSIVNEQITTWGVTSGIEVTGGPINGHIISNNKVEVDGLSELSAVRLNGAVNERINNNILRANQGNGFTALNSGTNQLSCNDITAANRAAEYNSNSEMQLFRGNVLNAGLDLYINSEFGVKDHRANRFLGGFATAENMGPSELLGSRFFVKDENNFLPTDPVPLIGWFQSPAGNLYECLGVMGNDLHSIFSNQADLCNFIRRTLTLEGKNDRLFFIRVFHLLRHLRKYQTYNEMPSCVQMLLNHPKLCGTVDIIETMISIEESIQSTDQNIEDQRVKVKQSIDNYAGSRSSSSRNKMINELGIWKPMFNEISVARRSSIDNGINDISDINCNEAFFDLWKNASLMHLKYLRDEEISETDRQYINTQSELCADIYGDPVHIFRALRSTYDRTLVSDRDDCIINNRSSVKVENRKVTKLAVFPNPAIDKIEVNWDHQILYSTLLIHDVLGKQVKEYTIEDSENKLSLDVSDLQEGVYTITIHSSRGEGQTETAIFIKAK